MSSIQPTTDGTAHRLRRHRDASAADLPVAKFQIYDIPIRAVIVESESSVLQEIVYLITGTYSLRTELRR